MQRAMVILIGFGDEYAELLALAGEHEITALPNEVKAHACGAFFLEPTRCGTLAIKRTLSGVSQPLSEAPPAGMDACPWARLRGIPPHGGNRAARWESSLSGPSTQSMLTAHRPRATHDKICCSF